MSFKGITNSGYYLIGVCIAGVIFLACAFQNTDVFIDREEANHFPGFEVQGEYTGQLILDADGEREDVSLQVAVYGENRFRALLILDKLPGESERTITEDQMIELTGSLHDNTVVLDGDYPLRLLFSRNRFTAVNEQGNEKGHLDRVERVSPTMGLRPPEDAIVLFDGTNLDHWDEGTRMTDDGLLMQGARTANDYGDIRLHVEAKIGFMPNSSSQRRANSGIYIQNRYEVQILDSFALPPQINSNGSLYNESAPRVNASFPPLSWQTYDVYFRAPRFDGQGRKTENTRVTVYLNGVLVQDNVELEQGTGAGGSREEIAEAELYLQDHTGPVRFRNVWLVEGDITPPGVYLLAP